MRSIRRNGWSAGTVLLGLTLGCNAVLGIDSAPTRPDEPQLAPGECRTHNDCLERSGEVLPDVCIKERCVPLLTDSCPVPLPQSRSKLLKALRSTGPQALIVGAFTPLDPTLFDIVAMDFDLALTELANTTGGLPAAGGGTRPVIAVACFNEYSSPEDFDAAAAHLIEELRVPAILPALTTADLQHLFEQSARSAHVFLLSPTSVEESLVDYPDDGLIWSILGPATDVAPVYEPLLTRSIEHLVDQGTLDENEPARVALVRTDDVRETNVLASAIAKQLGIGADDPPATFETFSITSVTADDPEPDYSDVILELGAFRPHIIIGVAGVEFATRIIPALEAASDEPPFYLLSPFQYNRAQTSKVVVDHPGLEERIAGVNFSATEDPSVRIAYEARFDSTFPKSGWKGVGGHENLYDAMYYLLYAAAAAGKASPVSGPDLVEGMRHLLAGRDTFDVGPDDLQAGFAALAASGSSITLNGAMGPPSFDPGTGIRHMPGSVWCIDKEGTFHADVLRLEGSELVMSFPCFEFGDP
jgi:hypothetical protein